MTSCHQKYSQKSSNVSEKKAILANNLLGVYMSFQIHPLMENDPGSQPDYATIRCHNGIQIRLRGTFEGEAECVRSPDVHELGKKAVNNGTKSISQ
jgi:hypothetical protein